jgi:hypothetical protein
MGARYYDPSTGRFTQEDALANPLDPKAWNSYVYVGGDPVNFTDLSGQSACHITELIGGGGIGPAGAKKGYHPGESILDLAKDAFELLAIAYMEKNCYMSPVCQQWVGVIAVEYLARHGVKVGGGSTEMTMLCY